ncbi:MAG: hypothetical protein R8F63_08020 [Acidimicrobiales bacterium]|nr:hypothetical protein [Acidimicrobiales bacterium]
MSDATSRRAVLKIGGGGALALLIGGAAGWLDRRDDDATAPGPAGSTTTTPDDCDGPELIEGIGAVGSGILTLGAAAIATHGWDDLDELLADVPDPTADPLAQAAAITAAEFRAGDTVQVDGWVLGRSEARAAAALALMDGGAPC